jgi:AAA-like domain/TIR domain/CHAT domain
MSEVQSVTTILILAANPKGTVPLRLDEEVREIKAGLERSRHRDLFKVEYESAARPRDVQRAMLRYRPQLVHFCGHGEGETGLVLEDDTGRAQLVSTEALADLFELFADTVDCVLLNACYSDVQAAAIAQHIDAVIGMNQPIGDRAAIEFVISFYDALGAGESVEFAFRLGRNGIQMQGLAEERTPVLIQGQPLLKPLNSARIFISYKRGVEPDEQVALALYEALSRDCAVFIDQTMTVGTRWAERIEAEIRQSDFLIILLSAHSVQSEMVVGEIETAHHQGQGTGKPMMMPIRVAYRAALAYPLSAYLNGINWAFWESGADTARLVAEVQRAIAGQPLVIDALAQAELIASEPMPNLPRPMAAAQPLEMPEGMMDLESRFYIERDKVDAIALDTIQRQGVTITIKGPRQMGKSSLLIRTMAAAREAGKRVAFLDFQLFDKTALRNADQFFRQFCAWLTDEVELDDRVEEFWNTPLGNSQRCTRYMQRYLLKELGEPLVLVMDEVESVFEAEFRTDFFSMLRSWHNNRATTPIWKQLDLALVTSTEPYQLIENLNQSPFNVGQVIELSDFSGEQVALLNERHGDVLTRSQERQLMDLLHGHPYLVRRSLYLAASGQFSVMELFEQAGDDRGPFGDHLRYHLFRMNDKPELIAGMLQVIRQQSCEDERLFFRLRGAGLVRRDRQSVVPRCRLYAAYFEEHLHG